MAQKPRDAVVKFDTYRNVQLAASRGLLCDSAALLFGLLSLNRSGVVEIDEFAVFPVTYRCKFENKVDTAVHYDNNPFWISADTNRNDLG